MDPLELSSVFTVQLLRIFRVDDGNFDAVPKLVNLPWLLETRRKAAQPSTTFFFFQSPIFPDSFTPMTSDFTSAKRIHQLLETPHARDKCPHPRLSVVSVCSLLTFELIGLVSSRDRIECGVYSICLALFSSSSSFYSVS